MQRHDLDLTSLIAGLMFVALGMLFLAHGLEAIDLQVRWVWPALLIGLGLALLASGARNGNGETAAGLLDASDAGPDAERDEAPDATVAASDGDAPERESGV